jgi:hypothetical protein
MRAIFVLLVNQKHVALSLWLSRGIAYLPFRE